MTTLEEVLIVVVAVMMCSAYLYSFYLIHLAMKLFTNAPEKKKEIDSE